MRTALWPATWGYMLDQLAGELSDDALAAARAHFLANVAAQRRAAGAAGRPPAVRRAGGHVARAVALLDPADLDARLAAAAARARAHVARGRRRRAAGDVRGADLAAVLATAVAMSPVSVRVRRARPLARRRRTAATFARGSQALDAGARARARRSTRRSPGPCFEPHAPRRSPARSSPPSRRRPRRSRAAQNYITWLVGTGLDARPHRRSAGRREHAAVRAAAPRAAARVRDHRACGIVRARGLAAPGEGTEPGLGPTRPRRRGRGSPRRWTA